MLGKLFVWGTREGGPGNLCTPSQFFYKNIKLLLKSKMLYWKKKCWFSGEFRLWSWKVFHGLQRALFCNSTVEFNSLVPWAIPIAWEDSNLRKYFFLWTTDQNTVFQTLAHTEVWLHQDSIELPGEKNKPVVTLYLVLNCSEHLHVNLHIFWAQTLVHEYCIT